MNPSEENIHLNASGIFFRILQAVEEVSSPQHPAPQLKIDVKYWEKPPAWPRLVAVRARL
jgi:hypothetical protein